MVRASGGRHPSDQAAHEFSCSSTIVHDELPSNEFGDPFMATRNDPLLHNSTTGPLILGRSSITDNTGGGKGGRTTFIAHEKNLGFSDHDQRMELRSPSDIFSRILHIYPTANISLSSSPASASIPKEMKPTSSLVMNDTSMIHETNSSSGGCVVDKVGMQNPPAWIGAGIKRRKNQAKKVVCVPAPAASDNRHTAGEVVPTDLWAWRKYGQKPIKGSPHPRSYYRCSSFKGCSALKQVERSRTDAKMLVITYTSEHNHPWPSHRNAGRDTRSQQLKANAAYNSYKVSPSPSDSDTTNAFKEEHKLSLNTSTINPTNESTMKGGAMLKEEEGILDAMIDEKFGQDQFPHMNYEPLQSVNDYSRPGDIFAGLGVLESTDPINLMTFCQGRNQVQEKKRRV